MMMCEFQMDNMWELRVELRDRNGILKSAGVSLCMWTEVHMTAYIQNGDKLKEKPT